MGDFDEDAVTDLGDFDTSLCGIRKRKKIDLYVGY